MGIHPLDERGRHRPGWSRSRNNVGIDEIHRSEIGCPWDCRITARQIVRRQWRCHQETAERRDMRQPLPFLIAHDHDLPLAMAGDDRGFSLHCLVDYSGQICLGVTEQNFSHSRLLTQKMTPVVT